MIKFTSFFLFLTTAFVAAQTQSPKYTLFVFEGSDWCVNCIKLEKRTLKDSVFIHYLEDQHIDIKRVDFPQRKKQTQNTITDNKRLAKKYHFKGVFPTLVLSNTHNGSFFEISRSETAKMIEDIQQKIKELTTEKFKKVF